MVGREEGAGAPRFNGADWYVVLADAGGLVEGPFATREAAQRDLDQQHRPGSSSRGVEGPPGR